MCTIEQYARNLGGLLEFHKHYTCIKFPTYSAVGEFLQECETRKVNYIQQPECYVQITHIPNTNIT